MSSFPLLMKGNFVFRLWVSFSGSRQAEQVQGGDNLVIRETTQESIDIFFPLRMGTETILITFLFETFYSTHYSNDVFNQMHPIYLQCGILCRWGVDAIC
jgi:hypothetical protein